MSLTDVPFGLAVTNASNGGTILQTGVTTSLTIAVVNNSGADIALASGADAAAFSVYLPTPALFSLSQLRAITVTAAGSTGAPLARTSRSPSPAPWPDLGRAARPSRSPWRTRPQAARRGAGP